MDKGKKPYWKLFCATFRLSAGTFGGGFVIVPLMRDKFVRQLHWIGEQEMLDLVAIAESSPGATAVNASILVGFHVAGVLGALVAVAGTVLPPLGIISLICCFYSAVRSVPAVNAAMSGMLAGVAAVICDVVFTMGRSVVRQGPLAVAVMAASFAAVRFWNVNIALIIILCGLAGVVNTLLRNRRKGVRQHDLS